MFVIFNNGLFWNSATRGWFVPVAFELPTERPTVYATGEEAVEAAQEEAALPAEGDWEIIPATVGGVYGKRFGHDEHHEEPADARVAALEVFSSCGRDCVLAINATAGLLDVVDSHPAVTGPILEGLNVHLGILLHG